MKYKCSVISKYKCYLNALLVEAWECPPREILVFFPLASYLKKQTKNIKHLLFGKHCAENLGTEISKNQFSSSRVSRILTRDGQVNQQLNQTALHGSRYKCRYVRRYCPENHIQRGRSVSPKKHERVRLVLEEKKDKTTKGTVLL